MRPCFGCTKELLQARISSVYYLHEWVYPDEEMQQSYLDLQSWFPGGVHPVEMADPDAVWAVSRRREAGG